MRIGILSIEMKVFTHILTRGAVITYLIHRGYLRYNEDNRTVFVPNEEIRQELII